MTKQELIAEVADNLNLNSHTVRDVLENAFSTIVINVSKGENVTIRRFGSFECTHRAAKMVRNIGKGTGSVMPAHYVPTFKASKVFKDYVSDKNPAEDK